MTTVKPVPHRDLAFDRIAWLMDRSLRVPGTKLTIGLDAIIELIPGLGDAATTLVQGLLVLVIAARNPTLPRAFITRMVVNILIDCTIGSIPIFGDIFDAYFKANTRNVKLLRAARAEQAARGEVRSAHHVFYLLGLAAVMLAVVFSVGFGAFWLMKMLADFIRQLAS